MSSAVLTATSSAFTLAYKQALENYVLADSGEKELMQAYELGRRAVTEHCNILDLVATHQNVILRIVLEGGEEDRVEEFIHRGHDFLAEVMAPFEMMHRGFADTIHQLQEVNATLEQRVDERTKALQESKRKTADLARLYQILSSINSAIVRLRDRFHLFKEACRIAVDQGDYRAAWVSSVESANQTIGETWCCRTADGAISEMPLFSRLPHEISALMSRVYSTEKPVIHHGGKNTGDESDCSYALFPLLVDGRVTGIFTLFSDQTEAFNNNEMRLLLELAGDLSFALDHIQKDEQLNYLANHDSLTGLPNRNLLLERLSLQLQTAARSNGLVALLMLDLLHFSGVNDTYGRHVGDNLLKQVGDRLHAATGHRETVARLTADRFAVTFTNIADARQVAHRLEQEVLDSFIEPFKINTTEIHIAVRVGLALFPSDATVADTLYKNSEIALKRAQKKQEPYLLYDSAMNERIIHSVTLEAKLRKAIEREELQLHYQPKVSTSNEQIIGLEALVRYADPDDGLVLPGRFIPLMEETGMITEIGKWVIKRASDDLKRWRRMNLTAPRVAFNVSPIQLRQKNFLETLRDTVPQSPADHGLDIEITESAVMKDIGESIPKLAAIREMGFGIAIDDFGTGYSSLSYLSRLPVDALKIDRSFIIDMAKRPNSLSIVSTIITLAHALELKVVAEGVDLEEQAKLLRLLRCDLIQGNLYGPPLPWDQMTELLGQ